MPTDYQLSFVDKGEWEFGIDSVFGLRAWNIRERYLSPKKRNGCYLEGSVLPWYSAHMKAECHSEASTKGGFYYKLHDSPHPECKCGIYAYWYDYEYNNLEAFLHDVSYSERYIAVGVVEGTGKVLVGSKGFRAEKAKIVAMAVTKVTYELCLRPWLSIGAVRKRLEQRYGVPVYGSFDKLITKHPITTDYLSQKVSV